MRPPEKTAPVDIIVRRRECFDLVASGTKTCQFHPMSASFIQLLNEPEHLKIRLLLDPNDKKVSSYLIIAVDKVEVVHIPEQPSAIRFHFGELLEMHDPQNDLYFRKFPADSEAPGIAEGVIISHYVGTFGDLPKTFKRPNFPIYHDHLSALQSRQFHESSRMNAP